MELNDFITTLKESLIRRGISSETAEKNVHSIQQSLKENDLQEISELKSADEVEVFAENLVQLLNEHRSAPSQAAASETQKREPSASNDSEANPSSVIVPSTEDTPSQDATLLHEKEDAQKADSTENPSEKNDAVKEASITDRSVKSPSAQQGVPQNRPESGSPQANKPMQNRPSASNPTIKRPLPHKKEQDNNVPSGTVRSQSKEQTPLIRKKLSETNRLKNEAPNTSSAKAKRPLNHTARNSSTSKKETVNASKGFYIFWITLVLTLPLTLALAAAFFGAFLGAFAGLAAAIVGLIAVLIALVAVGSAVSLVGIIYGVTQLFSFRAAGIYEIGLGIIVIGVVMLVSILLYNIAIRFLPWVIKKVAVLFCFTCRKIVELFFFVRRECYKL